MSAKRSTRTKYVKVKQVVQKYDGCALACFAMIANISFVDAVKEAGLVCSCGQTLCEVNGKNFAITLSDIKRLLKKRKINSEYSFYDHKLLTKKNVQAILIFDWDLDESATHCVIYDRGKFIDPGGPEYTHSKKEYTKQWLLSAEQCALIIKAS